MYEESFSTPLLVRYPKEIKPGTVVNDMVVNVDLAPTILDYAGVDIPSDIQGDSWRSIAAGNTIPWRDAVYYHYYEYPGPHMVKRHYGARTDRYKLIHFYYDVDEWELYDLEKDPYEMRNVYNNPAYVEVQEMMHGKLVDLRKEYGDSDELTQQFLDKHLSRRN
jgi:arylsulfatase A-like enzyme